MNIIWSLFLFLVIVLVAIPGAQPGLAAGGITPEQIYQARIDWDKVIGTWEALPDDDPLAENDKNGSKQPRPTLITLRKDGTCRVLSTERPLGSDAMWTSQDHAMIVTFPDKTSMELYVYGMTGEFMVTQCPPETGKDQLWSRVK
jgi:hypothetical protein